MEKGKPEPETGGREVGYARCPNCGERSEGDDLRLIEIDHTVVGEEIRSTRGVVCPACGVLMAAYSDYHRTDIVEGSGETWGRVRSIDED